MKPAVILLMTFFLIMSFSTSVLAKDEAPGDLSTLEVIGDLVWVRPWGAIHVGLGAIAYALSLPVTLPLKKADDAKEFLITYPFNYYFKRPLREM